MGGTLRMWRERLGLTQADLARVAGLQQSEVSQIERSSRLAPKLIAALEGIEQHRAKQRRDEEQEAMIERAWSSLGDDPGAALIGDRLAEAAWALLDRGDTELADTILAALPYERAQRLVDQFFCDDFPEPAYAAAKA